MTTTRQKTDRRNRKHRTKSRKPRHFDRRLLSYTVAAGAGLAVTQGADGRIFYSGIRNIPITVTSEPDPPLSRPPGDGSFGTNREVFGGGTFEFDFDGDDDIDFKLQHHWYGWMFSFYLGRHIGWGMVSAVDLYAKSNIRVGADSRYLITRMETGDEIGPTGTGLQYLYPNGTFHRRDKNIEGEWLGKTGFAGFGLVVGPGETQYGWMRLSLSDLVDPLKSITVTLIDWAYQTEPNVPIRTPAPGALGLLALGAVGVLASRQKKREKAEVAHSS